MPAPINPVMDALRLDVMGALDEALRVHGPDGVDQASIFRSFRDRGASRATIYRWLATRLASGEPGQRLARQFKAAAEGRRRASAERAADRRPKAVPPADSAQRAGDMLPVVVTADDITAGIAGQSIPIIDRLIAVMQDIELVRAGALGPNGEIQDPRMLARADAATRSALATAKRLHLTVPLTH